MKKIGTFYVWPYVFIAVCVGAVILFRASNTGSGTSGILRIFSVVIILILGPTAIIGLRRKEAQGKNFKSLPKFSKTLSVIAVITVIALVIWFMLALRALTNHGIPF